MVLWLGTDPLAHKYPMNSPYVYCNENPVKFVDLDGREITNADDWKAFGKDMYEATTAMLSVGLQLAANIEIGKSKSAGIVLKGQKQPHMISTMTNTIKNQQT